MTSYITINNTEIDPDSPITADLMTKLRDNPIAVFTDDASVPADLKLGMRLLGTLTTTSGATQTLSGLTLTNYKVIVAVFTGVSFTSATNMRFGSNTGPIISQTIGSISAVTYGIFQTDLATGVLFSSSFESNGTTNSSTTAMVFSGVQNTVTTASTSITFAPAAGTFDAGTIRVYGVR